MIVGCLTVCVTGAGAGVDSAWEQRKLKARKMFENVAEPQHPAHTYPGARAARRVEQQLLFLYSRQPGAHVWLMLIMEMGKDSSSAKGITFQPRKVVLHIHQDFVG